MAIELGRADLDAKGLVRLAMGRFRSADLALRRGEIVGTGWRGVRRQIVSLPAIRRILYARPAPGARTLRQLLDRGAWSLETQSELERRALALFRRSGLPKPQCQYPVVGGNRRLGTVDFAWPHARVIVEAEGFQFHSGREAWERDIARYNRLTFHGWTVFRLTYGEIQEGAEELLDALSSALQGYQR